MKVLLLLLLLLLLVVVGDAGDEDECEPRSCGDLRNISYPFRLKGDPRINCGLADYELACENNRAILYLYHGSYYVLSISYNNYSMRVVDTGLQPHNCSSLPRHSLAPYNFTYHLDPYGLHDPLHDPYCLPDPNYTPLFVFVNCGTIDAVNSSDYYYVDTSPCINASSSPKNPRNSSSNYVVCGLSNLPVDVIKEGCSIELMVVGSTTGSNFKYESHNITTYYDIHREMLKGVELSWSVLLCQPCFHRGRGCYVNQDPNGLFVPDCSHHVIVSLFCDADFFDCFHGVLVDCLGKVRNILDNIFGTTLYSPDMDVKDEEYRSATNSIELTGIVLLGGRTVCGILWPSTAYDESELLLSTCSSDSLEIIPLNVSAD
ncbi:hypothetical protein Syun_013363 [Stephania yunnanensis]|uniref:Wall-associated receptor kinase galacturonan-binding domain-containing protein n=1 Tax=Stephania yunnanensis TaxID=152371 RepID=A0AAP0PGH1_9MAGN